MTDQELKESLKETEIRYLTPEQVLQIDNHNKDVKIKYLEIVVLRLRKEVDDLKVETTLKEKSDTLIKQKEKTKCYIDKLKEEFEITTETWGFDPITGEIKDE